MEYPKVEKELYNMDNENLQKLASLFPSAVKDGQLDVNALKEELGQFEEVGQEKYELTWAGKQNAKKEARKNVLGKTLRYIEGDGVNENTTQNLYIEGDNLEVLKLLRKNYYGSINMIYIDPPYNTGEDFVYNDIFSMSQEELEKLQGERDEYGEKLQKNSKDSAKYHTNWLNMMYPRLQLAKDLLTDDGVIFISIDDNEVDNLKKICNEIFDESNFIDILMIEMSNTGGMKVGSAKKGTITKNGEYILIYSRSANYRNIERTPLFDFVNGFDTHFNIFMQEDGTIEKLTDVLAKNQDIINEFKHFNKTNNNISLNLFAEYFDRSEVFQKFTLDNLERIARPRNEIPAIPDNINIYNDKWVKYNSDKREESYYLTRDINNAIIQLVPLAYNYRQTDDFYEHYGRSVIRGDYWKGFWIDMGNVSKEGGIEFKNGKKPVRLIRQLSKWAIASNKNAVVLDFFAGSSTTAHAIMQLNKQDNGNRKFILVQVPENLDDNLNKVCGEAKKDIQKQINFLNKINKPHYITELGKQRIRNVIEQDGKDIGFKVFRVGETTLNWEKLRLQGTDLQHDYMSGTSDKDRLDFTPDFKNDLNVVYEIMLRQEGLPLTSNIENLEHIGKRTYFVAGRYLICLEETITPEMIERLSALNPLPIKFVFRDSAFDDNIVFKDETFRKLNALIDKNTSNKKKTYTVEFI